MMEKKINLFPLLCCPYDKGNLDVSSKKEYLLCSKCGRIFPVIKNVPCLLPDALKRQNHDCLAFFKKAGIREKIVSDLSSNTLEEAENFSWNLGRRPQLKGVLDKLLTLTYFSKHNLKKKTDKYFSLDIGCSDNPTGSVNMDIYFPSPIPPNFILASAEFLPFKDKTFEVVKSSYVIEHLVNPSKFIVEQTKLAKKKVLITTDNAEWVGAIYMRLAKTGYLFHDQHYFCWTQEYLYNLIKRLGFNCTVITKNLSSSLSVKILSLLSVIPRSKNLFFRDLYAEIHL